MLALTVILARLADIFLDYDATVAEINPLALTKQGQLVALDCHLEIDDDALFRHRELSEIEKDKNRVQPERTASEFERKAMEIDSLDHRGVAGRFIEFDGTMGLIIGGGGTGAALAHDLVLRGFEVSLFERGELLSGATGRHHGLLHSG